MELALEIATCPLAMDPSQFSPLYKKGKLIGFIFLFMSLLGDVRLVTIYKARLSISR